MLCRLEIVSEPAQASQAGRVPDGVPVSQPRVPCQPAEKGFGLGHTPGFFLWQTWMQELYLQSLQWILPFPTTLQVPWLPHTCIYGSEGCS